MTTITGNTFPVKDQIKALGGRWNPDAKGWDVPDAKAEAARALVNSAPKSRSFSHTRKCRCTGKYHSSWCQSIHGPGGYYDRLEGGSD